MPFRGPRCDSLAKRCRNQLNWMCRLEDEGHVQVMSVILYIIFLDISIDNHRLLSSLSRMMTTHIQSCL